MKKVFPNSKFCYRAIKALHRAEADSFAEIAYALNVVDSHTEFTGSSTRAGKRDSNLIMRRLWSWALKRWGREFATLEYRVGENLYEKSN